MLCRATGYIDILTWYWGTNVTSGAVGEPVTVEGFKIYTGTVRYYINRDLCV
jgi:hypothetical protein